MIFESSLEVYIYIYIFFLIKEGLFFFLNLFMAVLGLRFCARAFSTCGKWGPLFIAMRGPLTIAASLVVEHRLQTRIALKYILKIARQLSVCVCLGRDWLLEVVL